LVWVIIQWLRVLPVYEPCESPAANVGWFLDKDKSSRGEPQKAK